MSAAPWGVRDLNVRYGARDALRDVTLTVAAGSTTVVIGGDGSGKTSLLRALVGAVPAAAGSVRRPRRRRIGYVAGAGGVYDDLSVNENIAFVAAAYGVRGPELAARTRDLLRQTGLAATGERLAGHLSGGMRQKLAFALAMLHAPDLLVLDEPTTGVDPVSRAELWRLIAGAAAGGAGVVVSTTYFDEAERAQSVLLLDAGHTRAAGTPAEVLAQLPPTSWRTHGDARTAGALAQPANGSGTAPAALASAEAAGRLFGHTIAVDDVSLQVRPGEVVGLLGANGAGKTTLIRLLLGLLHPTSGRVRLFGRAPSRGTRARLGYVPQGLGLWPDLSVAENLAFSARAFGSRAPALEPELAAAAAVPVRDLPLGLRRRLAFSLALAHGPELLVLDEPTSGVDPEARGRLWATIHEAADAGAGVLVTTHHLDEADECDRLVILSAGRVVAAGTLAAIVGDGSTVSVRADHWETAFAVLEDDGFPTALVGDTLRIPGGDTTRLQATLDAHGVTAHLSTVPATLEETFVLLAGADTMKS